MRDENYTIKEDYTLPSGGLIYSKPVDPHVELKSMTTRDELKRTAKTATPYRNLCDVIEGCMIEKPAVHVYDMCLGDYEYLMHKLRVVTHSPNYRMTVMCPHIENECKNIFELKMNLDELKVKEFSVDEFKGLQTLELPKSGKTVHLRFQTPRMLDEISVKSKEMNDRFKASGLDYTTVITLMCIIESVDGNKLSPTELEDFCMNLPAGDENLILQRIVKMNQMIGLDTEIHTRCPSCGGEILTFFRTEPEFFRPRED